MKKAVAAATAIAMLNACVTPTVQRTGSPGEETRPSTTVENRPEDLLDVDISPELAVGYRPDPKTDEGGWWMRMDKVEDKLSTNASVIRDPALNRYVNGIVCRLAKQYCGDIRVYLVRHPGFNASMAPNGVMQVWSGLFLRAGNEAQLATVLGHELAHYYKIHSIKNWRRARTTADVLAFLSLGTAAFGVGFIGLGASIVALGGLSSYGRDDEREADAVGQMLMHNAGYDASEAAVLWERVQREQKASDEEVSRGTFFATHPAPAERENTLTDRSGLLAEKVSTQPDLGEKRYRDALAPHRHDFLTDELAEGDYGGFLEVLAVMEEDGHGLSEIQYFRGETYRKRGDAGDLEKARDAYRQALDSFPASAGRAPYEIYKSLGLVYLKLDQKDQAEHYLELYLAHGPEDSHDRAFIEQMVERLSPNQVM